MSLLLSINVNLNNIYKENIEFTIKINERELLGSKNVITNQIEYYDTFIILLNRDHFSL